MGQRRGEHLGENYWRVTLPDEKTTLVVTATRWQLITILPKNWTAPQEIAAGRQVALPVVQLADIPERRRSDDSQAHPD